MLGFRHVKTLQKFSSVHAAFHNHFNQDQRDTKPDAQLALAEWKTLAG